MRFFKKPIYAIFAAAIIFIGTGLGLFARKEPHNILDASHSRFAAIKNKTISRMVDGDLQNNSVKVARVIDGDTIEIEGGERVRYIGIDTPETVDPRKPVQCFGIEASKENKKLVLGKMVRLEKDITDRDKYHRLLRYVWLDKIMVNGALVDGGFAHSYSYPPDIKYQDQFVAAERKAREAKLGLWNSCGI